MRPTVIISAALAAVTLGGAAGLSVAAVELAAADPVVDVCADVQADLDEAIRAHVDLRVRLDDLLDADGLLDDLGVTDEDRAEAARREAEAAIRVRVLTDARDRACVATTATPRPTVTSVSRVPTQVPGSQVRQTPRNAPETGG